MTFLVVAIISLILSLLFADDAKLLSIIIDIIEDISLKDIGIYIVDSIVPERRAKRRAKKAQEEAERKKKREDWEKSKKSCMACVITIKVLKNRWKNTKMRD